MKEYKLSQLLEIKNGKDHKELPNGDYPVFGSGGVMRYVNEYLYDKPSILLPRKGSLNNIQYCDVPFWTVDTLYYTEVNEKLACPYYLYRYLHLLDLSGLDTGTGVPSMTFDSYYNIKVILPEIEEQKRVASVLQNLDYKIALNRQINDNLEEQLRLITSRYIFGSPYLKKKRIGEIATIKAGGDCPITFSKTRTQECNIPIFSNGTEDRGLYGFTNKANIEGHSITVAARGTIGYCERRLMPFVPIIRLLAITPKEDGAYIYLHQVIRGMKFKKNGSVQQQLTVPEISFIEIPYPHSSVLHEYNNVANPIVEMIERNINENEILTKQRDELLPLLMNGQATINYHLSVVNVVARLPFYRRLPIFMYCFILLLLSRLSWYNKNVRLQEMRDVVKGVIKEVA